MTCIFLSKNLVVWEKLPTFAADLENNIINLKTFGTMANFDIDKNLYHFKLERKLGNSVVCISYFTTYEEAEYFARHNGYHKYNKKKIEADDQYKNYNIIDLLEEKK